MLSNRAESKEAKSNAQASVQRAASSSRSIGQTNPSIQQPSPSHVSQSVPKMPQGIELVRIGKPPVDKICKYGAEEFRSTTDDDPKIAEF
ncbi:Protein MCM10 [Gossypium australe]|uniref:Protein MCM10 n=1 Tax=Gossypium australe TaxID=47621 RepID=A0A5B6X057_9ROSI|nr:Protein MCM10 [Gossypium australe]